MAKEQQQGCGRQQSSHTGEPGDHDGAGTLLRGRTPVRECHRPAEVAGPVKDLVLDGDRVRTLRGCRIPTDWWPSLLVSALPAGAWTSSSKTMRFIGSDIVTGRFTTTYGVSAGILEEYAAIDDALTVP